MAFVSLDLTGPRVGRGPRAAAVAAEEAVAVVSGAAGLERLETVWRDVSARASDVAAFLSFGYALAAARYHEGRGEEVVTAIAEWAGAPAAIVSVAVTRRAGVTVAAALGDPVTQYSDALLAAKAPQRLIGAALRAIAAAAHVDLFQFRRVRADSALTPALAPLAKYGAVRLDAPYADLDGADDVPTLLLAVAGAKQKRERARSRRRLSERGTLSFEVFRGTAAVGPLQDAFAVKSGRLARAGLYSLVIDDPQALDLFRDVARDPVDGASLVVARLSVGGAPAAYEVGIARGRRFHAYLGAVVEEFAGASPGKAVMEEALAWAKAEGLGTYDLLAPADRYKREWATGSVTVRDFAAPMTLKGRLYAGPWLRTVRPALRGALDRMPPIARRAVARAAVAAGLR